MVATRSHLFINYATEDAAFVDWLCLRLLKEGYQVWCDRLKLLGGESYPTDIDDAICGGTHRFLAVLSKSSIRKPNPVKERTLALQIARERKEDFVIPLNLDGLAPTDLGWMQSDLTFIPFQNWATGLAQLLRNLERSQTPKSDAGTSIAPLLQRTPALKQSWERLWSNLVPIAQLPKRLYRYEHENSMNRVVAQELIKAWPHFRENSSVCWSFVAPPAETTERFKFAKSGSCADWQTATGPDINFYNVGKRVINASLKHALIAGGLAFDPECGVTYFPDRPEYARFSYRKPEGTSWIRAVGPRSFWTSKGRVSVRYHLAPSLSVWLDFAGGSFVHVRIGLYITEPNGRIVEPSVMQSRRKAICRSWWNYEWLVRVFATLQVLGGSGEEIRICPSADEALVLSRFPLSATIDTSLDETLLKPEKEVRQDVELWERRRDDDGEHIEDDDDNDEEHIEEESREQGSKTGA